MPDEIVWVDKVLNPRAAVLTHSEAMTILKNAKTWISQPRLKAPSSSHKTTNSSAKSMPVSRQKEEYLQIQQAFHKKDEMKSILEMKAELEAIEKSKEVLSKAIEDGLLFSDGLPRLKPSFALKKDIIKSKKVKMNQTGKKLAQLDKGAINANALKNMFADDNEDVDMIDVDNVAANENKQQSPVNIPAIKEEDGINWKAEESKQFMTNDESDEDEEGGEKVAIEPPLETLDAVWRNYYKEEDASKEMENLVMPFYFPKSEKPNYKELIKDENFCSKLLGSCDAEWDVSSYLGLAEDYRAKDNEFLPKLSTLNSLYTAEDLDLLQYQAETAELNASRIRERQRVQHPIIKVPAKKVEDPSEAHLLSTKSISKCSTLRLRKPSKKPAPKQDGEGSNKSSIPHNTIIHEAIQFLEKSPVAEKYQYEIKDAYKKLSKYPLTFLEKMNLIHTSPKDASGMLCQLDDLGLRFSKETLEEFEQDCASLWPAKRERTKRNSTASGV